jgi:PadR family transcriptional regulator PadR
VPPKNSDKERIELLQGTLDMLILRTLLWGPTHGHGIAKAIEGASRDVLRVEHGSLYPALQRLLQERWITAAWKSSPNKRRARYYSLTAAGRRHLQAETSRWDRVAHAIANILRPVGSVEEL